MEGRILNARAILKQAESAGIKLNLNGDKLAIECAAKPPDGLLDAIKAERDSIVARVRLQCRKPTAVSDDERQRDGSRSWPEAAVTRSGQVFAKLMSVR
jgi:hypothetical protein